MITGCANTHAGASLDLTPRLLAEVQRPAPVAATDALRPTVALVLGGGGLRGFAHMGVLRALEEAGIKPDIAEADVLIAPAISVSRMSAKDEQERAIQAGYEAARAALPRVMARGWLKPVPSPDQTRSRASDRPWRPPELTIDRTRQSEHLGDELRHGEHPCA